MMITLNYVRHCRREDIFKSLTDLKRDYGFKSLDVKEGQLVTTVWHDKETMNRFQEFSIRVQELCRLTLDEFLNFYRIIFQQIDQKGRNPMHYCATGKFNKSNQTAMGLLNIEIEAEEGYDDFSFLCSELAYLDDSPDVVIDPKKRKHVMDEI